MSKVVLKQFEQLKMHSFGVTVLKIGLVIPTGLEKWLRNILEEWGGELGFICETFRAEVFERKNLTLRA